MENMTSYGYNAYLVFLHFASLTLIAESGAFFWSLSRHSERGLKRALPEITACAMLIISILFFGTAWNAIQDGLPRGEILTAERVLSSSAAVLAGLILRQKGVVYSVLLIGAGILLLPFFDDFLPWSVLASCALLALRFAFLAHRERFSLAHQANAASMKEALDHLPDGVLFAKERGKIVLVNITMLRFMARLLGVQYRNALAFWQALEDLPDSSAATKIVQKNAFLFRFSAGDAWLVQRARLTEGLHGWQITAVCVTELDTVTQALEAKNELLAARAKEQKALLETLEETERQRTLQEITARVHDILGQRISMLQQLLASPAPKDALATIVRIDRLLEPVPLDKEPHPADLVENMLRTYRGLGIRIDILGSLPRNMKRAQAFAAILREALSNAVCHGHASRIMLTLSERRMVVEDNGAGCPHGFQRGGGIEAMTHRLHEIGGKLFIQARPHFRLVAVVEAKMAAKRRQNARKR